MISNGSDICVNKKVSFNYFLETKFVAGISLFGTEVKSLRERKCSINDAHIIFSSQDFSCYVVNMNISEYKNSYKNLNHDPIRKRRVLLRKKEIIKISNLIKKSGYAVVVERIYFNNKGLVKLDIYLAKGKKKYDKRRCIKERDLKRDARREE